MTSASAQEGGGGSINAANLRTNSINFVGREGGGGGQKDMEASNDDKEEVEEEASCSYHYKSSFAGGDTDRIEPLDQPDTALDLELLPAGHSRDLAC